MPLFVLAACLVAILVAPASASALVQVGIRQDGLHIVVVAATAGSDVRVSNLRVTAELGSAGQTTHIVVTDEGGSGGFNLTGGPCEQGVVTGRPFARCTAPPLPFVVFSGAPGGRDDLVLESGTGDCLCGGSGGNDRIIGAGGADFIAGGAGQDVLQGGPGGDVIEGGEGDDEIGGGCRGRRPEGPARVGPLRHGVAGRRCGHDRRGGRLERHGELRDAQVRRGRLVRQRRERRRVVP